jgi:hypothetical protein
MCQTALKTSKRERSCLYLVQTGSIKLFSTWWVKTCGVSQSERDSTSAMTHLGLVVHVHVQRWRELAYQGILLPDDC